jgi:hypothetical protein
VDVGELCHLSSALRSPREARLASENIGRQRAELAESLHGSALAREFLRRAAEHGWPTAAAVSTALAVGFWVPPPAVLAGATYNSLSSLLSAAMKLLRLGQNGAQSLLAEALADAPASSRPGRAPPARTLAGSIRGSTSPPPVTSGPTPACSCPERSRRRDIHPAPSTRRSLHPPPTAPAPSSLHL